MWLICVSKTFPRHAKWTSKRLFTLCIHTGIKCSLCAFCWRYGMLLVSLSTKVFRFDFMQVAHYRYFWHYKHSRSVPPWFHHCDVITSQLGNRVLCTITWCKTDTKWCRYLAPYGHYKVKGFTFNLHHLANPKSTQANFILEFSQAANLITKFSELENCKKNLES